MNAIERAKEMLKKKIKERIENLNKKLLIHQAEKALLEKQFNEMDAENK